MPSSRTLPGKFTYDGLGASVDTRRLNIYGRGPSDKRRVMSASIGLEVRDASQKAGISEPEDVDLDDVVISRRALRRGKLASMSESLRGGLKDDDLEPLTGYRDTDGKVVIVDGNHRVVAMLMDGKRGSVKIRIVKPGIEEEALVKIVPKGRMKFIIGVMESRGVKPDAVAEESGIEGKRMAALAAGDDEPTEDEVKAMMDAVGKLAKAEKKYDLTDDDRRLGALAADAAKAGKNPSAWVENEDVWERAKDAASKTYNEGDDAYWPVAVHVYKLMGGSIKIEKSLRKSDLGLSVRDLERKLYDAARMKYGVAVYVRDVFPESETVIIASTLDMLYDYDIGDDGKVTLGEWEEIVHSEEYEPVQKARKTRLRGLMDEAIVKAGGADGLAKQIRISPGVIYAVMNRNVSWLGHGDAGRLAKVLGVSVEDLQEMLDEDAAIENIVPEGEAPFSHGDFLKGCSREYVAVPSGRYHVVRADGDAEFLAKALTNIPGIDSVEVESGKVSVLFSSGDVRGREVAIRARVSGSSDGESNREVTFLGTQESLIKAVEKGIVYGVVYSPDEADLQNEWATAEDIETAAHEYMSKSRRTRRQHSDVSDDQVVESYIAPCDVRLNGQDVSKGSWIVAMRLGEKSRELVKSGKMTGFSMGGSCSRTEEAA